MALLHPGKIPPDSTLTFVVELLEIRNGPRSHESFQEMDLNDDWKLSQQEVGQPINQINSSTSFKTTQITAFGRDLEAATLITQDDFFSTFFPFLSVTAHQVKEYLRKEFERHGYPPNDTLHENMMKDIFAKEDKNKDGFISAREFTYKHDEL